VGAALRRRKRLSLRQNGQAAWDREALVFTTSPE